MVHIQHRTRTVSNNSSRYEYLLLLFFFSFLLRIHYMYREVHIIRVQLGFQCDASSLYFFTSPFMLIKLILPNRPFAGKLNVRYYSFFTSFYSNLFQTDLKTCTLNLQAQIISISNLLYVSSLKVIWPSQTKSLNFEKKIQFYSRSKITLNSVEYSSLFHQKQTSTTHQFIFIFIQLQHFNIKIPKLKTMTIIFFTLNTS